VQVFWSQLWDKGVEIFAQIIANVISGLLLAAAGLILWRWRKRQELKEELEHRERVKIEKLRTEREGFARQVESVRFPLGGVHAAEITKSWRRWMEHENLLSIGNNNIRFQKWQQAESRFIALDNDERFPGLIAELAEDIRAVELTALTPYSTARFKD
jgi:hypothetical protein